MSQITVTLHDQTAIFTDTPNIFSGDVNINTVKFTFDDTWDDFDDKTAVFYNDVKISYPVILDNNNTAVVPSAVINKDCTLYFGVIGTKDNGNVKTSSVLSYKIDRGAICADIAILSPSVDAWIQILTNYELAMNRLDDMDKTLDDMNETLAKLDQRFIDAGVENKANIDLSNLNGNGINVLLSKVNMDSILNGETYSKHFIQSGTVSVDNGLTTVTFPKKFKSQPSLLCSILFSYTGTVPLHSISVYSTDITDSNATIRGFFTNSSTNIVNCACVINWIAIGEPAE